MDTLTVKTAKFRFLSRHLAATDSTAPELLAVALETELLGLEILKELNASES